MKNLRQSLGKWSVGLVMVLSLASGCQTWVPEAGMTLPSQDYLRHFPQYTPPSPPYPLTRELNALEKANQQAQDERPAPFGN